MFHHVSPIQNGRVFPVERWVPQAPPFWAPPIGSSQGHGEPDSDVPGACVFTLVVLQGQGMGSGQ